MERKEEKIMEESEEQRDRSQGDYPTKVPDLSSTGFQTNDNENADESRLAFKNDFVRGKTLDQSNGGAVDIGLRTLYKPTRNINYQVGRANLSGNQRYKNAIPASSVSGVESLKCLLGQEPAYIVTELTRSIKSLKDCINRTANDRELLEVFLQVLSEAYMADSTPNMLISLFQSLKEANFLQTLVAYFIQNAMVFTNDQVVLNDKRVKIALKHSLCVITKQLTKNPSSISVFRGIHAVLSKVIGNIKNNGTDDNANDIDTMFVYFSEQIKAAQTGPNDRTHKTQPERKPPDNFKLYPVAPTAKEILGTTKPFLRANRIDGKYADLHDYLDVQFRLLREDFIGPLREGLAEYRDMLVKINMGGLLESNPSKQLDIKVYENVKIVSPVITQHGLCYKLKLEMTPQLQNLDWQFSKRLIYGSLVCLTDTDFKDVICATVVEREDKNITDGFFVVRFELEELTDRDTLHRTFVMVESSGYFEAYRHVLKSLQRFQDGDLPFEKYIVKCETLVEPPRYLRGATAYDLRPLVDTDVELYAQRLLSTDSTERVVRYPCFSQSSSHLRAVQVSDPHKWPSKELLHMDESQYKAVQTALTKEFAIIQGPPGTGKTYIGLQIVKTLLHNKTVWAGFGSGNRPMLIVCFTNHALDQFLEGIVKFYKGDIVRVGGRSSSKVLMEYNLKTYRQAQRDSAFSRTRRREWYNLMKLTKQTLHLTKRIELYKTDIISEDSLLSEMGYELYNSLKQGCRGKFSKKCFLCICKWLKIRELQVQCNQLSRSDGRRKEKDYIKIENDAERRLFEVYMDFDEIPELEKAETKIRNEIRMTEVAFSADMTYGNEYNRRYRRTLKALITEKINDPDIMTEAEANAVQNVWKLDVLTRWRLYRLWIKNCCSAFHEQIENERFLFELASERYQIALKQEENAIMQQATVIGMTTSCAAKYQSVLRHIGPKIVIVEEAAEVLEAHIVTTLSKGCEHLILIGDHKQLRPNPTVYKLAVKYNLEISLFERMIKNGIKFNCLDLQHRMRPEISSVMRHIYPDLKDHEHVKTYPCVKGVSANMFLVNHSYPEMSNEDVRSYSNAHEAEYAVALCRYLCLQGYEKSEITVLTTYTGQLMCLRNLMPNKEFEGVKVTVVDNYQGEENTIIILSLVRSNADEKIGFLNIENRICVALSRAKVGFFLIGNFEHLAAHSDLWKKITEEMKVKGAFGEGIKLCCQNHPLEAISAQTPEDFLGAPEGGCKKKCDIRLECGHKCERYCHTVDKEHKQTECYKDCNKTVCDLGHTCPDKCFIKCKPCMVPITRTLSKCGHTQQVPCSIELENFKCQEPCQHILNCGHQCQNACGYSHTVSCKIKIQFTWSCGHNAEITCGLAGKDKCPQPCRAKLNCEHTCKGTCGSCFEGKIHMRCTHGCNKRLICGHECKDICNNCPPCNARCKNWCVHKRCDRSCGEPCQPCNEPCQWECKHHRCMARCSEPCSRPRCNKPCKKRLSCKHACIGLCGEPCPKYCRICDKKYVCSMNTQLTEKHITHARFVFLEDCEHIVEYKAMDKYMDMVVNTNAIKLKSCPICMTPIRRCLRYGDKINQTLQDIERVKHCLIGNNETTYKSVEKRAICIDICDNAADIDIQRELTSGKYDPEHVRVNYPKHFFKSICKSFIQSMLSSLKNKKLYTERQVQTIEIHQRLALALIDLILQLKAVSKTSETQKQKDITLFYEDVLRSVFQPRDSFSEQEIKEYTSEILRGTMYVSYLKLCDVIQSAGNTNDMAAELRTIDALLFAEKNFTKNIQAETVMRINRLKEHAVVEGLRDIVDERLELVEVISPPMSHWLKCPNNHIYGIEDSSKLCEDFERKCSDCEASAIPSGNKSV